MAAAQGVSLFVQRNGLKAVAANGPLSVQAHAGAMSILADKDVVVTSSNEAVEILAKNTVVLHGADSAIRLEGNAITFETPGVFEVKGAGHPFTGGDKQYLSLRALPGGLVSGPYGRRFQLRDASNGTLLPEIPYFLELRDGTFAYGRSDKDGYTDLMVSSDDEVVQCHWGKEARKRIAKIV